MKIFDFEQKLKKEFGNINVIYNSNSNFRITTMIATGQTNEVVSQKRVTYSTLEELERKSNQFKKYKNLKTFLVEMKCTDASKWTVTEINKKTVGRPKQNNVQYKRNIKPEHVKKMDEYLLELKANEIFNLNNK